MKRLTALLFGIPGPWVVGTVFLISGLETAVVLGIFLPGEVTLVLGGVLAALGRAPLPAVLAAGIAGPVLGDVAGYFVGRRYGEDLVRRRLGARRWNRAHRALSKKAGWSLFLARVLPFVRGVLPTTAGAVKAPRLRFFAWDLPTAAIWGAGSVLAGYLAGRDYERVLRWAGRFSLAIGIALAAAILAWLLLRRKRALGTSRG